MLVFLAVEELTKHFADLTDPRVERTRWHELSDLIVIALCGTICGCESWEDLPRYGREKFEWLSGFLELPNGIPSADTFARVFQRLNPDEFLKCLLAWIEVLRGEQTHELIAIDGQTLKGSDSTAFGGRGPLHLVRAWATQHRLVLGQQACAEKSNEIEAIPRLLKLIDVKDAIVTIDAMGCQKEIAQQIREQEGDYVLALKDNHPKLCEAVRQAFEAEQAREAAGEKPRYRKTVTQNTGHGRDEERTYYHMPVPKDLPGAAAWKDLQSLGMVIRRRDTKGAEQIECQFHLCSLRTSVRRYAKAVRKHWSIENELHWMLDVNFAQDASRIRKDHGPENSSILRQAALMILRHDTQLSGSLRGKRKRAGWNNQRLEDLLLQKNKH